MKHILLHIKKIKRQKPLKGYQSRCLVLLTAASVVFVYTMLSAELTCQAEQRIPQNLWRLQSLVRNVPTEPAPGKTFLALLLSSCLPPSLSAFMFLPQTARADFTYWQQSTEFSRAAARRETSQNKEWSSDLAFHCWGAAAKLTDWNLPSASFAPFFFPNTRLSLSLPSCLIRYPSPLSARLLWGHIEQHRE